MSHIFSNPSDTSAGALFKAPNEIFVCLLVFRRQEGHRHILLDELAGALRQMDRPDGVRIQYSRTGPVGAWQTACHCLERDGLIGQFGISLYAIVFLRKSKHSVLGLIEIHVLQVVGEHSNENPFLAQNVSKMAARFLAEHEHSVPPE